MNRIVFMFVACFLGSIMLLRAQIPKLDWPIETVSEGYGFTEGPALAIDGTLFFSDMDNGKIIKFNPLTNNTKVWQNQSGRSNGLFIKNNYLYACEALGRSIVRYNLKLGPKSREVLVSTYKGDSLGSPNDITVTDQTIFFSEFWLQNIHKDTGTTRQIFQNRVYSFNMKNKHLDTLKFDFISPNGIAISPKGSRLFIGDRSNKLYHAKIKKGKIGKLKLFADIGKMGFQSPDGMAIAKDGKVFLALYKSDLLLVLSSDGSAIGTISTGPLTSNCILAADGKTLYITADKKLKRVNVPIINSK
ncbi:SMP-30/gluconolactonase/LRE family protein [Lutibacter citreus]|uniref:SMP-30/gluconolactonase/LRE family protein n=1 Tax=Lutibacter citreus TaxID=2138210 RepID=UPI000DBE6287|nr:SMP-30/gluconolactonase/LRE family protein [Lutibacter citreus]